MREFRSIAGCTECGPNERILPAPTVNDFGRYLDEISRAKVSFRRFERPIKPCKPLKRWSDFDFFGLKMTKNCEKDHLLVP